MSSSSRFPHADRAVVPERKLIDYLLSETHPDGRGKSRFFAEHGFSVAEPQILAAALRRHVAEHPALKKSPTPFGTRYVVEGILQAPDGRTPVVRVIWFVDRAGGAPRLVTAYPIRRR